MEELISYLTLVPGLVAFLNADYNRTGFELHWRKSNSQLLGTKLVELE